MKKDWAEDLNAIKKAGSLKKYILRNYNKKSIDAALADGNFMVTEREDTIQDFFNTFDMEINQYATRKDAVDAYPEMEPSVENYDEGIKITQFNFAVYEIIKEVNERYGHISAKHPEKSLSKLVEISDFKIWDYMTENEVSKHKTLRELIQRIYPAKMVIGVAQENRYSYTGSAIANLLMKTYKKEVTNICPDGYNSSESVDKAILFIVKDLYQENKTALEKNPDLTISQMIERGELNRRKSSDLNLTGGVQIY